MYRILTLWSDPHIWVSSYNVVMVLTVLICWRVAPRWAEKLDGIDPKFTSRAVPVIALAVFAGGHVHFLLYQWRFALDRAKFGAYDTLLLPIHAGGAIIALVLATPLALRRSGISLGRFGDALTPTVGLGIALARIGCLLEGCCAGVRCDYPWCLRFPEPTGIWYTHRAMRFVAADAHLSAPVHPLQLYFSAVGIVIMATGFWLHRRRRFEGEVALVGLTIFSVTSYFLEDLREGFALRAYWHGIPQLSWVALGMAIGSLTALAIAEIVHRARRPAALST